MQQNSTTQVTLHTFKDNEPRHEVNITAAFDGSKLVVSEYMSGEYVRQYVGQHDFTYKVILPQASVTMLSLQLGAAPDDKSDLLQKLAAQFNGEGARGALISFLSGQGIEYEEGETPISWF